MAPWGWDGAFPPGQPPASAAVRTSFDAAVQLRAVRTRTTRRGGEFQDRGRVVRPGQGGAAQHNQAGHGGGGERDAGREPGHGQPWGRGRASQQSRTAARATPTSATTTSRPGPRRRPDARRRPRQALGGQQAARPGSIWPQARTEQRRHAAGLAMDQQHRRRPRPGARPAAAGPGPWPAARPPTSREPGQSPPHQPGRGSGQGMDRGWTGSNRAMAAGIVPTHGLTAGARRTKVGRARTPRCARWRWPRAPNRHRDGGAGLRLRPLLPGAGLSVVDMGLVRAGRRWTATRPGWSCC